MILQEIDINEAEKILKDESIWDRTCEDGQTKETFSLNKRPEHLWLGIFLEPDNEIIGCFFVHPENQTTLGMHIQIIEKYRKEHAYNAGMLFLNWFTENTYEKLTCQIPTIYPDVYRYAKKFGFLDEGINRASYKKNGRLHNQLYLGITKEEAKILCQQARK